MFRIMKLHFVSEQGDKNKSFDDKNWTLFRRQKLEIISTQPVTEDAIYPINIKIRKFFREQILSRLSQIFWSTFQRRIWVNKHFIRKSQHGYTGRELSLILRNVNICWTS